MLIKILILIILGIYIVLGVWNIGQNDSDFLIQRFYRFLKNAYLHFKYG